MEIRDCPNAECKDGMTTVGRCLVCAGTARVYVLERLAQVAPGDCPYGQCGGACGGAGQYRHYNATIVCWNGGSAPRPESGAVSKNSQAQLPSLMDVQLRIMGLKTEILMPYLGGAKPGAQSLEDAQKKTREFARFGEEAVAIFESYPALADADPHPLSIAGEAFYQAAWVSLRFGRDDLEAQRYAARAALMYDKAQMTDDARKARILGEEAGDPDTRALELKFSEAEGALVRATTPLEIATAQITLAELSLLASDTWSALKWLAEAKGNLDALSPVSPLNAARHQSLLTRYRLAEEEALNQGRG